jgi:hypothetical protein
VSALGDIACELILRQPSEDAAKTSRITVIVYIEFFAIEIFLDANDLTYLLIRDLMGTPPLIRRSPSIIILKTANNYCHKLLLLGTKDARIQKINYFRNVCRLINVLFVTILKEI